MMTPTQVKSRSQVKSSGPSLQDWQVRGAGCLGLASFLEVFELGSSVGDERLVDQVTVRAMAELAATMGGRAGKAAKVVVHLLGPPGAEQDAAWAATARAASVGAAFLGEGAQTSVQRVERLLMAVQQAASVFPRTASMLGMALRSQMAEAATEAQGAGAEGGRGSQQVVGAAAAAVEGAGRQWVGGSGGCGGGGGTCQLQRRGRGGRTAGSRGAGAVVAGRGRASAGGRRAGARGRLALEHRCLGCWMGQPLLYRYPVF